MKMNYRMEIVEDAEEGGFVVSFPELQMCIRDRDMIGATDETVIDTLGKLSEYDIYVEDINGELEECYEMMYKEPVQESDISCLLYTSRCV